MSADISNAQIQEESLWIFQHLGISKTSSYRQRSFPGRQCGKLMRPEARRIREPPVITSAINGVGIKADDYTDKLRERSSGKGGMESKIPKVLRTS